MGQIGSDSMGDPIPCVECHHKTTFDGGTKNDPYGVMLYGNESTGFKAPLGSKTMDVSNIQGFLDLSDEFSPEVSKRLENASELFKHIDFSQKPKSNENSKVLYPLVKFIIASPHSDYVKAYPFHIKDTAVFPKDVSTLNIHRQMDSIRKLPEVKRYNDSVELSIKNRFKKR